MKISDYIVEFIEQQQVKVVFGYAGGMITHLMDSLTLNDNVSFVQTYHEQSAAIAAEGYAIESKKCGVAIATSGPGATNMITGIADAYFDSIPVLYITGQVNTYEFKGNKPIRQQGFQETDVVSIVKPITKYATIIEKAEDVKYELQKAFYIAKSGRPGPVLLDIPMNIQRIDIDIDSLPEFNPEAPAEQLSYDFSEIKRLIQDSKTPLILVGNGCTNCIEEVNQFVKENNLPVISSLKGIGVFSDDNPNYLGMIGSYGNRNANMSIGNTDLLIVLGSRLDTRQTGAMTHEFLKKGQIIHVDIDRDELENNRLTNRTLVHSDVVDFLHRIKDIKFNNMSNQWNAYLENLKTRYGQEKEIERFIENKAPYNFIQLLNDRSSSNTVFCTDVGQNQMWAAQTLLMKKGQTFLSSGGLAPMGYAIPAAVGVAFANPQKDIFCICGDGGFHIALQSLMLIAQYNLPIKVFVLNNRALGMITQFQKLYFEGRMAGTMNTGGYNVPHIGSISRAYNMPYFKLEEKDLKDNTCIDKIFNSKFCIVEYSIDGLTTVSPKLEYNKPIEQPTPMLPEEELEEALNIRKILS